MEPTALKLSLQIDAILATLLAGSHGNRCTLRLDHEGFDWSVAIPCSEALRPGVKSLKGDGSINQRAAATARWIEKHRRNLVQPDLSDGADPAPPPALLKVYGVKAQMLSPIFRADGWLQGWISVHYLDGPHAISKAEIAALDQANAEIRRLTGIGGAWPPAA
jgi:maleate isomerase